MYRWHWFKRFVLEQGDDDATRRAVTRPTTLRVPSRRARQAELMALARLEKRDAA